MAEFFPGRGLNEFKKGRVVLTPEEQGRMREKGLDPRRVMSQSTERIRTEAKLSSEQVAIKEVEDILQGIDLGKYTGFVKIAEFAAPADRESVAQEVSEHIKSLAPYAEVEGVGPVLNKLNAIHEYLSGNGPMSRKNA